MGLRSLIASDFKTFLNSDEFAESIIYTPHGGAAVTVNGVVVRQPIEALPLDRNRTMQSRAEVYIPRDATYGITTVTPKLDVLQFPRDRFKGNKNWIVLDILDSDDAMWHLLVGE